MNITYRLSTLPLILLLVLFALGAWGWGWNVYKLAHECCTVSGMLVLRAIGIFVPPLGAVVGYL